MSQQLFLIPLRFASGSGAVARLHWENGSARIKVNRRPAETTAAVVTESEIIFAGIGEEFLLWDPPKALFLLQKGRILARGALRGAPVDLERAATFVRIRAQQREDAEKSARREKAPEPEEKTEPPLLLPAASDEKKSPPEEKFSAHAAGGAQREANGSGNMPAVKLSAPAADGAAAMRKPARVPKEKAPQTLPALPESEEEAPSLRGDKKGAGAQRPPEDEKEADASPRQGPAAAKPGAGARDAEQKRRPPQNRQNIPEAAPFPDAAFYQSDAARRIYARAETLFAAQREREEGTQSESPVPRQTKRAPLEQRRAYVARSREPSQRQSVYSRPPQGPCPAPQRRMQGICEPAPNPFAHLWPDARFCRRYRAQGQGWYLEGEAKINGVTQEITAVPGEYRPFPPPNLPGFGRYIPAKGGGYWIRVRQKESEE